MIAHLQAPSMTVLHPFRLSVPMQGLCLKTIPSKLFIKTSFASPVLSAARNRLSIPVVIENVLQTLYVVDSWVRGKIA
jgi:hypothetical protein